MQKTFKEIINDFLKKKYQQVYFLMGEEPYYINIICKYLENNVLSDNDKILNQVIIYGSEKNINKVIDQSNRYPIIGGKCLVVILKEAQFLSQQIDDLYDYINNPVNSTILVICYKNKTIDQRNKIYKILKNKYNVILFNSKKIHESKIPIWIYLKFKKMNKTIDLEAAYLLKEYVGTSLEKITNELNKIVFYLTSKSKITSSFIIHNISVNKQFNYVEWKTAIAKKDIKKVQNITLFFLENTKEYPINLLISILCNFFINIIQYHTNYYTNNRMISRLYKYALNNYDIYNCLKIILKIKEADIKLKGIVPNIISSKKIFIELLFKMFN